MKVCFKCFVEKPLSDFYVHKAMADGHLNKCKDCTKKDVFRHREMNLEKVREYDRNRPNREERNKRVSERVLKLYKEDEDFKQKVSNGKRKWALLNKHKRKAQSAASNALRDGKLQRKTVCEHCNLEKKLQKHHWSYEEQHWLDVIWLCTSCHGKEHKRLNSIGRNPDTVSEQ